MMNSETATAHLTQHPARTEDVLFLTNMFLRAMQPYIAAARGHWNESREREQFIDQLSLNSTAIIRQDGEPIGFLTAIEHPQHIELHTLCLTPEHHGRGIGTTISQQLIADARSRQRSVVLSVLKSNPRARTFYERVGFIPTGESVHHIHMRIV
jgi:ribosomal protein S18 acetylase RimI-like enzyme